MSVSFEDVTAMSDIMSALDDVESGRANHQINEAIRTGNTAGLNDGQQDIAAMKGILSDLYSVAGDELQAPPAQVDTTFMPESTQYIPNFSMQDDMSYEEYLAMSQGKQLHDVDVVTGQVPQHQPIVNGPEWVIVAEAFAGVKSLKRYTIKHNVTGTAIISNIALRESAGSICNMLNTGETLENPKLLGIISSGIQYTTIVESMVKAMNKRRKVLRESNYSAAEQCDKSIQVMKQKATSIKSELHTYLTTNNLSYK